ncbi:SRPBCC family protein [Jiulongibacter sp. NS-SX5]|uniref:SRPBCC family protein n=1 Tax=Jiulongibacter sp. NS-SX5 TaxID=3463854 RepID=UPI004059356A
MTSMDTNKKAPVFQKEEILITGQAKVVWQTLTDINSWPEWNNSIQHTQTSGKINVGQNFHWKSKGNKINSTIHTFIENNQLGWHGKAFGATAIHNWFLEEHQGFTKVRVEESMEGLLVVLLKKKMNQIVKNDMKSWLQSLKEKVEKDNTLIK